MQKFPHTRAQLAAIARQYSAKPHDSSNGTESVHDNDHPGSALGLADEDGELNRVSTSFLNRVVSLLVDENEDELKALLKSSYHIDAHDGLEQNVLDLMHKHRDDVAGVPFLFLTPTRRPISRPSSRASSHSYSALPSSTRLYPTRPETPNSAPTSPLAQLFRRPHTPVTSPLAGGISQHQPTSYMTARSSTGSDYSPQSSPILAHAQAQATQAHAQFTASLPASPISSPRLLNAKASEFRPVIQRPLSAAPTAPVSFLRAESPDLWAHNPGPGSPSLRATSNLAIAAPLIAEQSPSFQPRSLTPSSSLRTSLLPGDDDEDDPFNPFRPNPASHNFHSNKATIPDEYDNMPWYHTMPAHNFTDSPPNELSDPNVNPVDLVMGAGGEYMFTDGMTPFDVLSSVFGSSLAPSELEDALTNNGFDFDRAMAWLVDRTLPSNTPSPPPQQAQQRMQNMGGRVTLVSRGGPPGGRGAPNNGARFGNGAPPPPGRNGRPPPGANNRVCRYFMAGECLRADCRFSHDLERALCRFWLRGTCAKGEQCEFLHHLPKDTDMNSLSVAMARANVAPGTGPFAAVTAGHNPPQDEFPALGYEGGAGRGQKRYGGFDPGRTRFAAAVKKPFNAVAADGQPAASNGSNRMSIVAPRPSPRLRLRPPHLMPTLPTGEVVNNIYMTYRQKALQLGAARIACLSRAAEAWRRGDGAAAKRFSKEAHEMNAKMSSEMASAAEKVVRERARVAETAVKGRDSSWSDDPMDRTARGQPCGGGFGVILGVASASNVGTGDESTGLTSDERMEAMLDLHGLHSNEATEVLEQYLLAIESEHFYGLVYAVVGEEKHTGTQDPNRGASRNRLAAGVKEWLHKWGYPWSEREGIICIDPLTHATE